MKILVLPLVSLAIASSGAFALAHGSGMDGMMGHQMQGCMQMMQSMSGGGAHPPNDQWRHRQPGPGAEGHGGQHPSGSSSQ